MAALVDRPLLLLVVSFLGLLLSAMLGVVAQKAWNPIRASDQNELAIVQSAALTLLGLIVGFSFSMAVSRYDQRKNLEEAEANAIGTAFVRADFMQANAGPMRAALKAYLDHRILIYVTQDPAQLKLVENEIAAIGAKLWSIARSQAAAEPTPVSALVAYGVNDVLNSADSTAAAWLDRIPIPAWWLMVMIGVGANVMLGFGAKRFNSLLLYFVPLTVSVSLFLIADIDSPRGGVVQVQPINLNRLAASLSVPADANTVNSDESRRK